MERHGIPKDTAIKIYESYKKDNLMNRLGEIDEVAKAIAFLASDEVLALESDERRQYTLLLSGLE